MIFHVSCLLFLLWNSFRTQHRKGKRAQHSTQLLKAAQDGLERKEVEAGQPGKSGDRSSGGERGDDQDPEEREEYTSEELEKSVYDHAHAASYSGVYNNVPVSAEQAAKIKAADDSLRKSRYSSFSWFRSYGGGGGGSRHADLDKYKIRLDPENGLPLGDWFVRMPPPSWFVERARYAPLRLSLPQRQSMRLVQAALHVTEYTSLVDSPKFAKMISKNPKIAMKARLKRTFEQIRSVIAVLDGLVTARPGHFDVGLRLLEDGKFELHQEYLQEMFEIGRRHKIRNPEKMRSSYGKLLYLLQDAQQIEEVRERLGFSLVKPIETAYSLLKSLDALHVLADPYMALATGQIVPDGKRRAQIDAEIRYKERAQKLIVKRYTHSSPGLTEEVIRAVLSAFGDNHAYLTYNRDPCDKMLYYLQQYFGEEDRSPNGIYSLAIREGEEGSRLTHTHKVQYQYALQTLTLWREIIHSMYRLWSLAEQDMLDPEQKYVLQETGQGLQRVQNCPRVEKAMRAILYRVQREVGNWVGSSVIHLGDENVPNSFMFIDKYTQVPRILLPIVTCLRLMEELHHSDERFRSYIEGSWGTVEHCRMTILTDFFKSAFDGSGADNFFQAGSCIDGRLTSAWHWCSQLPQKPYYRVFQLTGFVGFDGKEWDQ